MENICIRLQGKAKWDGGGREKKNLRNESNDFHYDIQKCFKLVCTNQYPTEVKHCILWPGLLSPFDYRAAHHLPFLLCYLVMPSIY